MGKGVLVSLNKVYFSSNQPRSIRRVMSPIVFRRDFDEDSDKIFIRGLVVLDRFVQCRFVLDEVLPSTIVIPPHLERTCSELEAFLDLRSVFFSVRQVRQGKGRTQTFTLSSSQEHSRAE